MICNFAYNSYYVNKTPMQENIHYTTLTNKKMFLKLLTYFLQHQNFKKFNLENFIKICSIVLP